LVVDDDEIIVRAVARSLSAVSGVTPRTCTTFDAALAELHSDRPWGAFVFDVTLRGVQSGWDLLAIAERRHPHVRTLMMTGHDHGEAAGRAMLHGAAYLGKPVDSAAVALFARDALNLRTRRENELRVFALRAANAMRLSQARAEYLAARLLGLQDQMISGRNISGHTASSHRKAILECLREARARWLMAEEKVPAWADGEDEERFDVLLDRLRVAFFRG
jgi:DNA-binding NtrC family response regulator